MNDFNDSLSEKRSDLAMTPMGFGEDWAEFVDYTHGLYYSPLSILTVINRISVDKNELRFFANVDQLIWIYLIITTFIITLIYSHSYKFKYLVKDLFNGFESLITGCNK